MDTDAWEQAGLFEPESPDAGGRRALLEFLTDRGATIDQMVDAHELGRLPGLAGDLVIQRQSANLSVGELAQRSGVSVDHLQRVMLSLGFSVLASDELPENWVAMLAAFEQAAGLMSEDALLAFTRVLGAAATNIAEAAVALFYAELGPGTDREGAGEIERAQISEAATLAFSAVPDVLTRVLAAHFERASRRAAVVRGWAPASECDTHASVGEVVAIGFVDLVGSTHWAEGLSLRDHSLALARFESAAWSSAVESGGRVIKMIGDEVFFVAPTASAACRIGTDICGAADADPLLPQARGAVGYGLANPREGDYFGPLVNLVSRLTKSALPGTLVVTHEVAGELNDSHWILQALDPQPIRGAKTPVSVFAVTSATR